MDCGCGLQDGEGGKAGGGEVGRRPTSRDRQNGEGREPGARQGRIQCTANPAGAGGRATSAGYRHSASGSPIPVVETCRPAGCNRGSSNAIAVKLGHLDKSQEARAAPTFGIDYDGFNCLVYNV